MHIGLPKVETMQTLNQAPITTFLRFRYVNKNKLLPFLSGLDLLGHP